MTVAADTCTILRQLRIFAGNVSLPDSWPHVSKGVEPANMLHLYGHAIAGIVIDKALICRWATMAQIAFRAHRTSGSLQI
jgi:hypothetical protein